MKTLSRRDFLKVSGVAAASVAATAVLGPGLASASSLNLDTREGEMQAGEGVQTGILPEVSDIPEKIIKYCRNCELACVAVLYTNDSFRIIISSNVLFMVAVTATFLFFISV